MKKKTKEIWEVIIILLLAVVILLAPVYFWDKNERERSDCLEPYALEICQERDLHYSRHSSLIVFCKEDMRDYDSLRFKFNRIELGDCRVWK